MDCWIPWKLCPLKARQDPRQKQKCKNPRGGGFEPLYILTSLGSRPKPNVSSREQQGLCFKRGGGLQIWTKTVAGKAGRGNSHRAVIGFCRRRTLQGLGGTERASRLLFCGEGWLVGREQGTGNKSYRGAVGLVACQETSGFSSVVRDGLQGVSRAQAKNAAEAQSDFKIRGAVGFWG